MSRVKVPLFGKPDTEQFRIPTDLPDLAFLRRLAVQGRLVYLIGEGANTDIISFVPSEGSTFFYYGGIFSPGSVAGNLIIRNDGQDREHVFLFAVALQRASYVVYSQMKMDSLVGDGIKAYTVNVDNATGTIHASIFGWTENTSRIRDVAI